MGCFHDASMRWLLGLSFLAWSAIAPAGEANGWGAVQRVSTTSAPSQPAPATRHLGTAGKPLFVNALVDEKSPYLQDYAHSPIRWWPWGDKTSARARDSGKLVFVSIGYSSCHWCHVMARESFDDLAVAAALNRGFVSVKIDREERPDVDRHFLARLEAMGVAPGWPTNLVLTPDYQVIWAATYLSRDALLSTLARLEADWRADPGRMRQQAAVNEAKAAPASNFLAPAPRAIAEAYSQTVERVAADFDAEHKGFGTGRKFPAPAELGLLRDAFLRSADGTHARMFVETLHAIARGGLYDPVDGGVFRYSIARSWNQPHFEKMLDDQAQVARLMCQGQAITGDAALGRAASGIIEFVLSRFATPSGLYASAFDSESEGLEGAYYQWSDIDQARLSAPLQQLAATHLRRVMQSNGDILLVPAGADVAPVPQALLAAMREIRRTRPAPRRDDKAITAWNANMVAALAECATPLGQPKLATEAATRMRRLLAANARGGRLARYSINGQAVQAATIEDLAWTLSALATLHQVDGRAEWTAAARRLLQRHPTPDDEAFARELHLFARDRTGIAASAVLLQSLTRLARQTGDKLFANTRNRVAELLSAYAGAANHGTLTAALRDLHDPAPAPVAYAAAGLIRLSVAAVHPWGREARFVVTADIRPGWHINSSEPKQDYLRPTRISLSGAPDAQVSYPDGKPLRFGNDGVLLSVLDGVARFHVRMPAARLAPDAPLARIEVALQTCSDQVCLAPETVELAGLIGVTSPDVGRSGR